MLNVEFLQYLNLALKQSTLSETQQDQLWFDTKTLLDSKTLNEIQNELAKV